MSLQKSEPAYVGCYKVRAARLLLLSLLLLPALLSFSGCTSTEPENYSSRPWDSPRSWENGLPSGLTEGR
jgi:hypothetical protein